MAYKNPADAVAAQQRYRERHPERVRAASQRYRLKARLSEFGLTLDDYQQMLERQGGLCAICRQPETVKWQGRVRALNLDHCHRTGKPRALLCNACNHALGAFNDDPQRFEAAAAYLREHCP